MQLLYIRISLFVLIVLLTVYLSSVIVLRTFILTTLGNVVLVFAEV